MPSTSWIPDLEWFFITSLAIQQLGVIDCFFTRTRRMAWMWTWTWTGVDVGVECGRACRMVATCDDGSLCRWRILCHRESRQEWRNLGRKTLLSLNRKAKHQSVVLIMLLIPDDCLDHKNAGKKGLVNQMDIRKHFMHFSNLSMPLRGTLLLPRDRNVLEDFPSKLKGLNMNLWNRSRKVTRKNKYPSFQESLLQVVYLLSWIQGLSAMWETVNKFMLSLRLLLD